MWSKNKCSNASQGWTSNRLFSRLAKHLYAVTAVPGFVNVFTALCCGLPLHTHHFVSLHVGFPAMSSQILWSWFYSVYSFLSCWCLFAPPSPLLEDMLKSVMKEIKTTQYKYWNRFGLIWFHHRCLKVADLDPEGFMSLSSLCVCMNEYGLFFIFLCWKILDLSKSKAAQVKKNWANSFTLKKSFCY